MPAASITAHCLHSYRHCLFSYLIRLCLSAGMASTCCSLLLTKDAWLSFWCNESGVVDKPAFGVCFFLIQSALQRPHDVLLL